MTKDSDETSPVRQHRTNSKPRARSPKKSKAVVKEPVAKEVPVEPTPPKKRRTKRDGGAIDYDAAKLEVFLDFLRETGSIEGSCAEAKINSRTLRRWRTYGRDPEHPEYEIFKSLDPRIQAAKQCYLHYSCPDQMDTRIAIAKRKLDLIQNGATETNTTVNLLIGYVAKDAERGISINEHGEIDWETVKVSWVNRNEKTVVVKRPVSATILAPERGEQDLTGALKVMTDLNLIPPSVNDEVAQLFESEVIPRLRVAIGRSLSPVVAKEDPDPLAIDDGSDDLRLDFGEGELEV